jgi:hypothetical protein
MRQNVIRSAWKVAAVAMVVSGAFCGQALAVNDVNDIWSFDSISPANTGSIPTGAPFTSNEGAGGGATAFHASTATVWSTPVGNGTAKSLSSTAWAAGDFYEFDTTNSGNSNFGFQFDQISSSTGPRDFKVQYSVNGGGYTDLPGGAYSIQNNTGLGGSLTLPTWSSAGAVAPVGLDTYTFDLRSITALNTATTLSLRLTALTPVAAALGSTFASTGTDRIDNAGLFYNFDPTQPNTTSSFFPTYKIKQPFAAPVLPATGDVVFGTGSSRTSTAIELVRGSIVPNGAAKPAPLSAWTTQNYTKYMKFDNLNSTAHNVHGNLLGVDAGVSAANGGTIYSYATQGTQPLPAPQSLATTNTASTAATRLGGLSVSPGNTKIAVAGMDTGKVLIYDYTAGNGSGTGAALGNLRQSNAVLDTYSNTAIFAAASNSDLGTQEGTAWLNDSTALAFSASGNLYEVAVTNLTATATLKKTVTTSPVARSATALAYNPAVSPYIYAMYGGSATAGTSQNKLFIFDPTNAYADLTGGGIDFSSSAYAVRDIALDAAGDLIMSTAGSTAAGQGRMEYIPGITTTLGTTTANSSVDWYLDETFGSVQSGIDVGFAPPAGLAGDYNGDLKVNAADYVLWRKSPGTYGGNPAGYNTWRANFGTGGPGSGSGISGAAVPEPASAVLLLVGLVGVCFRRRSA